MTDEFDPTAIEDKGTEASGGDDDIIDTQLPTPPPPPSEVNTAQPFQPGATSTPYQPPGAALYPYHGGETIEMTDFDTEQIRLPDDDIPLLEGFFNADENETLVERAKKFIQKKN